MRGRSKAGTGGPGTARAEDADGGLEARRNSIEALAASRRLDGQVTELDRRLSLGLQEMQGTTQQLQGAAQELQDSTQEHATTTAEAIRKLEQGLKGLEDLARRELQPSIRGLKEQEAADANRLSRDVRELQHHIVAIRTAGASATARCLSCFNQRYQEANKVVIGVDGKVYKRRPITPSGGRHQADGGLGAADAWAGQPVPVPVGNARIPTQGAAGPSLRRQRSGVPMAKGAAGTLSAPDIFVEQVHDSIGSTQGGSIMEGSKHELHSIPDTLDGSM